jgi:uncharacterized protein (DUF1800 family)
MTLETQYPRAPRGESEVSRRLLPAKLAAIALTMAIASCSQGSFVPNKSQRSVANSHNDIVRFLEQATFGPSPQDIAHLEQDLGGDFNAWLAEQFAMGTSNYPDVCCDGSRADTTCNQAIACGAEDFYALPQTPPSDCPAGSTCRRDNYTMWRLQQIFYRNALTAPDQLRQRVFFALDQIHVTSAQAGALNYADRMTDYPRMIEQNAFGNFRQILYDLSRNPTMGQYLDNITNTRTQPNENYAREVMQLFSIGLVVLNPDGTTDGTPTYNQDTVVELTRALSGWVLAAPIARNNQTNQNVANYRDPLVANAGRHDTGQKVLFAGSPFEAIIPAGQTVDQDLNSAIDILFNHPNVGTFIGKALIQMMVTSNPSRQYVTNVTQAFNNNGSGVRGDMTAVIRAILLDPEARNESPAPDFGKLREPVLAVTNLLRTMGYTVPNPSLDPDPVSDFALTNPNGTPTAYLAQAQDVFRAPTVFNFFPPDFAVPGALDLLGPEFGILSTTTALSRDDLLYQLINGSVAAQSLYRPNFVKVDLSSLMPIADDSNALVEALNQTFLRGQISDDLRSIFVNSISSAPDGAQRVKEALYLVSSSALYQVQR